MSPLLAKPGGHEKIDMHHHFRPPNSYASRQGWSVAQALDEMDANGVALAVAYAGPVTDSAAAGTASASTRLINDFSAEIVRSHPGRFGTFASLPMLDPDACLTEIAYAADVLGSDGFGISTCYGSLWLGDPVFRPIFEELNRRKSIVFVHPVDSACPTLGYEADVITGPWIEWPANTARTIMSLMVNGVLRQFPNIRFIFCHAGGVLPSLIGRIAGFSSWPVIGPKRLEAIFPDGIETEFARLYFECAQAYAPEAFEMLARMVPRSHMMFGSDYDNFPISHSTSRVDSLGLDAEQYDAHCRGNALELLGR